MNLITHHCSSCSSSSPQAQVCEGGQRRLPQSWAGLIRLAAGLGALHIADVASAQYPECSIVVSKTAQRYDKPTGYMIVDLHYSYQSGINDPCGNPFINDFDITTSQSPGSVIGRDCTHGASSTLTHIYTGFDPYVYVPPTSIGLLAILSPCQFGQVLYCQASNWPASGTVQIQWPPLTPGAIETSVTPCLTGHATVVVKARAFAGQGSFSANCKIFFVDYDGGAVQYDFTLPAGGVANIPIDCNIGRGTWGLHVVEFCGGQRTNTWNEILPLTVPRFTPQFPSAALGDRGFVAGETIIRAAPPAQGWSVRWQRTRGFAPDENGALTASLVEDGAQTGGSVISGSDTAELHMTGFATEDIGFYTALLIPPGGTLQTAEVGDTVRLMDNVGQPVFTAEPKPMQLCPSQVMTWPPVTVIESRAQGDAASPVEYQWYLNGELCGVNGYVTLPGGGTLNYRGGVDASILLGGLSLPAGKPPQSINLELQCVASNAFGEVRSRRVPVVIDFREHDCDADGVTNACEIVAGAPDVNQDWTPDSCQCICDTDSDGRVAGEDLANVLQSWGPLRADIVSLACDFDADGFIGGSDLALLLSFWGKCGH